MQSVETCANQCLRSFLHKVIHRFSWITEKSRVWEKNFGNCTRMVRLTEKTEWIKGWDELRNL